MANREVFLCDAARTPIGRFGGALAKVRTDDLAAVPIKALLKRNTHVDWEKLDAVYFGCANQAGEDNRNVARMAALLAGLPDSTTATAMGPFWVSATAIRSPRWGFAPGCTSHSASMPVSIPAASDGMRNSDIAHRPECRLHDLGGLWQRRLLQVLRIRHRHLPTHLHPLHFGLVGAWLRKNHHRSPELLRQLISPSRQQKPVSSDRVPYLPYLHLYFRRS